MSELHQALREPARGMATTAVLSQPVDQLVGVGDDAVRALRSVGIHSVLDLGASALFGLAQRVAALADGDAGPAAATPLPADMLDDAAQGRTAAEVARGELSQLRMLNITQAKALGSALAARTVRDLGLWPPALAARRLVQAAMGATELGPDPSAPAELQPRMGQLPVDRVVYQQLYFECLLADAGTALAGGDAGEKGTPEAPAEAPAEEATAKSTDVQQFMGKSFVAPAAGLSIEGLGDQPLDLTEAVLGRGFEAPGLGLRVSVAQTWTPVGLSLGQLLHSVALAPGEATRIAVVDWSRNVTSQTDEGIFQDEALSNSLSRNRAINEVTGSVAREMQEGRSSFSTTGASWGLGAGAAGSYKGVTAAVNFGYSRTDANGSAFSSSSGQRELSAQLSQNVQDRTEQNASLSRGRRASIVSEVGTREAERLSTRVVANYNHMHALSVLYFEVVQLYRARTEVIEVEPLLYLPVRPFDFSNEALVERYRGLLAEVALNPAARDALLGIPADDAAPVDATNLVPGLASLSLEGIVDSPPYLGEMMLDEKGLRLALGPSTLYDGTTLTLRSDEATLVEVHCSPVYSAQGKLVDRAYSTVQVRGDGSSDSLPVTEWAPVHADRIWDPPHGYSTHPYRAVLGTAWRYLGNWTEVHAQRSAAVIGEADCFVVFVLRRLDGKGQPTGDPVRIRRRRKLAPNDSSQRLAVCQFEPDEKQMKDEPPAAPPFDLAAHLRANALHYTMALLRRADPGMLGLELGRLRLVGRPLLAQVDPVPVAHAGNYLVFRWRLLDGTPEWQALLKRRGLAREQWTSGVRESLVPVASGGVFAEAVLGRFNSAEKLDLTRFWNWQDSPIPLVPTEIAPLQAGIRSGAEALRPGSLGAPNLRQQDAPALPDPGQGVAEVLKAAVNGAAFRDVSGMNALLAQGGQAMALSAQGAREFMAKAMETVSSYGARVNHGRDMDERAKTDAAQAGAPGGAAAGAPGGAAAGTGAAPGGSGSGQGGGQGGGQGATLGGTAGDGGGGGAAPRGPGPYENAAFTGPGATPATTPPASGPAVPVQQPISVEIRTGVSEQGPYSRGLMASLDGHLSLSGLPVDRRGLSLPDGGVFVPPQALAGEAAIDVHAGSGSAVVVLDPAAPAELTPRAVLHVGRLNSLGFAFVGEPLPGVPEDFGRGLEENWAYVNAVPIPLPPLRLAREGVRLRIAVEIEEPIAMERQFLLAGKEDEYNEFTKRTVSIPLAGIVDGTELDAARLEKLRKTVADGLDVPRVRREISSLFTLLGTVRDYHPVIGCTLRYDAASKSLEARFPLVNLKNCRIVEASR